MQPQPTEPLDRAMTGSRFSLFFGRVLIARGRDAVDVSISTTFGPNTLAIFRVFYEEIPLLN